MSALWHCLPELETGGFLFIMWVAEHNFLQSWAQNPPRKVFKWQRRTHGSHSVAKRSPGERVSSCLRGCKAFASWECATCEKNSPTDASINVQFSSKTSLGLEFREWKFVSVRLLTGGIKSTLLPWQDPWWGDSATHPYNHVFHFCPKGSGLI